jgi:hypothetical protein
MLKIAIGNRPLNVICKLDATSEVTNSLISDSQEQS